MKLAKELLHFTCMQVSLALEIVGHPKFVHKLDRHIKKSENYLTWNSTRGLDPLGTSHLTQLALGIFCLRKIFKIKNINKKLSWVDLLHFIIIYVSLIINNSPCLFNHIFSIFIEEKKNIYFLKDSHFLSESNFWFLIFFNGILPKRIIKVYFFLSKNKRRRKKGDFTDMVWLI